MFYGTLVSIFHRNQIFKLERFFGEVERIENRMWYQLIIAGVLYGADDEWIGQNLTNWS